MDVMHIITVVAAVATVVALVFAWAQLRHAQQQARDLQTITSSLSTRYLRQFPNFSTDIASLLARARQRIDVFCDLPAYGLVSNQQAWFEIEQVIRRKLQEQVEVDVMFYDKKRREEVLREQADHKDFRSAGEHVTAALSRLLEDADDARTVEELTQEQILQLCLKRHEQVANEVYRGASAKVDATVSKPLPVYFWMIDTEEAVFSIPIFSGDSTEYGFSTRDRDLVAALLEMRDRYRKMSGTPRTRR